MSDFNTDTTRALIGRARELLRALDVEADSVRRTELRGRLTCVLDLIEARIDAQVLELPRDRALPTDLRNRHPQL